MLPARSSGRPGTSLSRLARKSGFLSVKHTCLTGRCRFRPSGEALYIFRNLTAPRLRKLFIT